MYKLNITDKDINIDIEDIDEYIKYIEKLTNIQWKVISDFEDYIISEYGDIINISSKKILKSCINKDNYHQIALYKNNIHKTFLTHRLVYSVFINNKDIEDYSIHHKDGNRSNNHYSNLEKMNYSKHRRYHYNQEVKKYLNLYKKCYDSKYKDHLSTKEIAKKYKISEDNAHFRIRQYKIYLFNNKDINKFINLNFKEKRNFYSNIVLKRNRKKYLKEYLEKVEEIYNRKNKEHLTNKQLAKIYNVPEYIIGLMVQDIKIFIIILNRNFDKFYKLSRKEKIQLRKKITDIERKEYLKEYLEKAEEIYNRKDKEHLIDEQLVKIYNIPKYTIRLMIKDIKIYIYILNRDLDKFYKLTSKEKRKLRKKITTIGKWNNNILDIGKQIKDLKLSGLSTKDIAKKLNLSKNKIFDIYKRYKKLIENEKTKDELKSIKNTKREDK